MTINPEYETRAPRKAWSHFRYGRRLLNQKQHVIVTPVCAFVQDCPGNKHQKRDLLPSTELLQSILKEKD